MPPRRVRRRRLFGTLRRGTSPTPLGREGKRLFCARARCAAPRAESATGRVVHTGPAQSRSTVSSTKVRECHARAGLTCGAQHPFSGENCGAPRFGGHADCVARAPRMVPNPCTTLARLGSSTGLWPCATPAARRCHLSHRNSNTLPATGDGALNRHRRVAQTASEPPRCENCRSRPRPSCGARWHAPPYAPPRNWRIMDGWVVAAMPIRTDWVCGALNAQTSSTWYIPHASRR